MLDQNTDRMWFVIGAVIVGAAIIFIANGTMPDIFASVTESFNQSSEDAVELVADIEPHELVMYEPTGDNLIRLDNFLSGTLWGNNAGQPFSGTPFRVHQGEDPAFRGMHGVYVVPVKPNTSYQLDISGDTNFRRIVEFGDIDVGSGDLVSKPVSSVKDSPRYGYYMSRSTYVYTTLPETRYLGVSVRTNDGSMFDTEGFEFSIREAKEKH